MTVLKRTRISSSSGCGESGRTAGVCRFRLLRSSSRPSCRVIESTVRWFFLLNNRGSARAGRSIGLISTPRSESADGEKPWGRERRMVQDQPELELSRSTSRDMRCITSCSERELDDLAHFNNVSTISMSFGSGLLSIAVAIGVADAFQVEATRFGEILAFAVAPILALMAVGFLIFAEVERRRRQSLISSVKSG